MFTVQKMSAHSCLNFSSNLNFNDKPYPDYWDMGPVGAQYVLFTSLQKLDQAKRSRTGMRLRRGLLIAVTALKAKQLLWNQQEQNLNQYVPTQSTNSVNNPVYFTNLDSTPADHNPNPLQFTETDFNSDPLLPISNPPDSSTCNPKPVPYFPPLDDLFEDDNHSNVDAAPSINPSKRLRLDEQDSANDE